MERGKAGLPSTTALLLGLLMTEMTLSTRVFSGICPQHRYSPQQYDKGWRRGRPDHWSSFFARILARLDLDRGAHPEAYSRGTSCNSGCGSVNMQPQQKEKEKRTRRGDEEMNGVSDIDVILFVSISKDSDQKADVRAYDFQQHRSLWGTQLVARPMILGRSFSYDRPVVSQAKYRLNTHGPSRGGQTRLDRGSYYK